MVIALSMSPLLQLQLLLAFAQHLDLHLECSYNGQLAAAGNCMCASPWQGARCNQLPEPRAGRTRDAAHYAELLGKTDAFIAVCDPSDLSQRADCTDGLAEALNRSGTVFVPLLDDPRQPGQVLPWRTRGIRFLSDNARVIFEHGVKIEALRNSTYSFGCHVSAHALGLGRGDLAAAHNRRNLSVLGYGALWRMWRSDYMDGSCTHSQFRMGFRINNCSDLEVAGLTIRESGGDGMIVMSSRCRTLTPTLTLTNPN